MDPSEQPATWGIKLHCPLAALTDCMDSPLILLTLRKTSEAVAPDAVTLTVIVVFCPTLMLAGDGLTVTPASAVVGGRAIRADRTSGWKAWKVLPLRLSAQ